MRGGLRLGSGLLVGGLLVSGLAVGVVPPAPAAPSSSVSLRDSGAAMVEAKRAGQPVEVSALTDEHTRVVADPVSGRFTAEVSAGVARVSDGVGGWRAPDLTLVAGADGRLHPVAARLPMSVSNGGGGDLVSLSVSGTSVGLGLPVVLPTPSLSGDTATYVEVLPGVDVVARADVDTVSTFVVVKTRQAGLNPAVRALQLAVSGKAQGTARVSDAGEVVVPDSAGTARVRVSAAAMWDSKGAAAGLASRDRVVAGDQAKVRPMGVGVGAGRLDVAPDATFLDDPETVYPVVIDPTLSDAGATYFKRFVSNNCFTYSSNTTDGQYTGNAARVGYNGWDTSSCGGYYESQVSYRFNWPTALNGANVIQATFKHANSYSVQQSPCDVTHYGHGIDVGLTWSFSNSASSWASRPSFINSTQAYNDYAAGNSPSYCSVTKDVSWDLTSQMQSLFGGTPFTEFHVGMAGHASGDKFTWRHFNNLWGASSSSRPLMSITFVPNPDKLVSVGLASNATGYLNNQLNAPGSTFMYTGNANPVFTAKLPGTTYCMSGSSCYYAQFRISDVNDSSVRWYFQSARSTASATVLAQLPTSVGKLIAGHTYAVDAWTINGDYQPTNDSVGWSPVTTLTTGLRLFSGSWSIPTWSGDTTAYVQSGQKWTGTAQTVTTNPEVWYWCIRPEGISAPNPWGATPDVAGCVKTTANPSTISTGVLLNTYPDGEPTTPYTFRVWVCYVVQPGCFASQYAVNLTVTG